MLELANCWPFAVNEYVQYGDHVTRPDRPSTDDLIAHARTTPSVVDHVCSTFCQRCTAEAAYPSHPAIRTRKITMLPSRARPRILFVGLPPAGTDVVTFPRRKLMATQTIAIKAIRAATRIVIGVKGPIVLKRYNARQSANTITRTFSILRVFT